MKGLTAAPSVSMDDIQLVSSGDGLCSNGMDGELVSCSISGEDHVMAVPLMKRRRSPRRNDKHQLTL